jgi:hypothetical protein
VSDDPVPTGGAPIPPAPPDAAGEAPAADAATVDSGTMGAPLGAAPNSAPKPPGETRRVKRKRRRRRPETEPESEALTADAEVDEHVPAFARSWPRDVALVALVAAFEAGNYARVRKEAPALAENTEDEAVRRAARELRRRVDPDPVAVYMLMAAAALLVFLASWYLLHPHSS